MKILVIALFGLVLSGAKAFETAQSVTATPITTVPFTITTSGNYFLPANLTSSGAGPAIIIDADQVVLDLNGRSLIAAGTALQFPIGIGIYVGNHENVVIQNGDITGFGWVGVFLNASATGHNLKNEVRHVSFNHDLIGLFTTLASINLVEHCNFEGGSIGVLDIASDGGDRFQQNNFQHQVASQAIGFGAGIVTGSGKGVLVEDCLFADEGTIGVFLQSVQDKLRFDTFVSCPTKFIGGVDVKADSI